MSDKNRNISDINDQKTAEQQAFSEEIRRRLAEPGSGKPTLDEFKVMVYKDREKRRKKRNALIACIVAAFIVGYLTYDDLVPEVGADKNPKETIQTEDGVIIEDGGWGSSEEEDNVFIVEEWENIGDIKGLSKNIKTPGYIPEGYLFTRAEAEILDTGAITIDFSFKNKNTKLEIKEYLNHSALETLEVDDITKIVKLENSTLYMQKNNIATVILDNGNIVNIIHYLNENEIISIVKSLSN